jgi:hypothetical protein
MWQGRVSLHPRRLGYSYQSMLLVLPEPHGCTFAKVIQKNKKNE